MCFIDKENEKVVHTGRGGVVRADHSGLVNSREARRIRTQGVHPKFGGRNGCGECQDLVNDLIEEIALRKVYGDEWEKHKVE